MKNRYLEKLATIIDMGPDGEIRKVGPTDEWTEARIRNAKRVRPPVSETLKPIGERALRIAKRMAIPAAVAGGVATGIYTASKAMSHEKSADIISPEHKKEIAQTGVLVGSGIATAGALDRFVKPRMNFRGLAGKAKYIGLIGGANLAADYGAVKINKAIEQHDKQAQIDIKPSHQGLLHKKLGIPQDEKITSSELSQAKSKAEASGNSKLMKQVVFAQNAKKWHHE